MSFKLWHAKTIGDCDVHRDIYEEGNPKPIAPPIMFDAANALVAAHNGEQEELMNETPTPQGQSRSETGVTVMDNGDIVFRGVCLRSCADLKQAWRYAETINAALDIERAQSHAPAESDEQSGLQEIVAMCVDAENDKWPQSAAIKAIKILAGNLIASAPSPAQEKQVEASVGKVLVALNWLCGFAQAHDAPSFAFEMIDEAKSALATAVSPSEDTKRLREALEKAPNPHTMGVSDYARWVQEWQKPTLAAMSSPSVTQTETETSAAPPTLGAQGQTSQETDGVH